MENHSGNQALVRHYMQAEQTAYSAYEAGLSDEDQAALRLGRRMNWLRRTRRLARFLSDQGHTIPDGFCQPYGIPVADRVSSEIPLKYQFRAYNILRDYARVTQSAPELLATEAKPATILDPSSGGCGVFEALRHFGHDVTCRDYYEQGETVRFGKAYRRIHADIGASVPHFNGQSRPYGFDDGAFDYVFCFQALDAYAAKDHWAVAVHELLRIASTAVILVFNPPHGDKNGLTDAIYRMLLELQHRSLDVISFQCPDTNLPGMRLSKPTA